MARKSEIKETKPPITPEVEEIIELHIWEKVAGKYHTRETTVLPGRTFIAGKDAFINDPVGWKYIGPVEG